MLTDFAVFTVALFVLLMSAKFFTNAAETLGKWLNLPSFVIGIFIVGIGTSLPELVSGVISVTKGASEIVPGNIIGANISNILLVTGLSVALNGKSIQLNSAYIYIDLHFLIGSFFVFSMIAFDGTIHFYEAIVGVLIFGIYAVYLIRGGTKEDDNEETTVQTQGFPVKALFFIVAAAIGIYFGAEYTVQSVSQIASALGVPQAIIALTILSLGTTLPELAVNLSAIKQGKAEMAVGNVLGSSVFNTLVIPGVTSAVGTITVSHELLSYSLPIMAAAGLLFYLLTQDKRMSVWEGLLFVCIYLLFIVEITL